MRLVPARRSSNFVLNHVSGVFIICRVPGMTTIIPIAVCIFVTIAVRMRRDLING